MPIPIYSLKNVIYENNGFCPFGAGCPSFCSCHLRQGNCVDSGDLRARLQHAGRTWPSWQGQYWIFSFLSPELLKKTQHMCFLWFIICCTTMSGRFGKCCGLETADNFVALGRWNAKISFWGVWGEFPQLNLGGVWGAKAPQPKFRNHRTYFTVWWKLKVKLQIYRKLQI